MNRAHLALCLLVVTVPIGDARAGVDFPSVIPADEIRLDEPLPQLSAHDLLGGTLGNTSGDLCTFSLENFRLRSSLSQDGGQIFAAEVPIAGGGSLADVLNATITEGSTDQVLAALMAVDPAGGLGLQVSRSDDFCQTWSTPQFVVGNGDTTHGVEFIATGASASGVWAVYYHGRDGEDPYVTTSTDAGNTWKTPVRLDGTVAPDDWGVEWGDVAVDAAGNVYAVFVQDRGFGRRVWYTRSTDQGTSFETERDITPVLPASGDAQAYSDIAVANDGSVLIAFWDIQPRLYVVRSTDQGQSYTTSYYYDLSDPARTVHPVLFPSNADGVVFMLAVDETGLLTLHRSLSNGASFLFREFVTSDIYTDTSFSMARTAAGKWLLAWSDLADDTYAGDKADVQAKTSPNMGDTWSSSQQVNNDSAGANRHEVGPRSLAPHGTGDDFFISYLDGRDDDSETYNVYGNRGTATPTSLVLQADQRVDTDAAEPISPGIANHPVIATDGVDHVYAAFSAGGYGPYVDMYVSTSADGGYTFGTPLLTGGTTPGTTIDWLPHMEALPGGFVYLVYLSDDAGGTGRQVRFARSADYGQTWLDYAIDTVPWPAGYTWDIGHPAPRVAALPSGMVYVVYSSGGDIYFQRSADTGITFGGPVDIDSDSRGQNRLPLICAHDEDVVVTFLSPNTHVSMYRSIWAVNSQDSGQTFSLQLELRPPGLSTDIAVGIDLACGPSGDAVAFWAEPLAGPYRVHSNRWDGVAWTGEQEVPAPAGLVVGWPAGVFTDATHVSVAYESTTDGGMYVSRSADSGSSWAAPAIRLDALDPNPDAPSYWAKTASDGAGGLWVSWLDEGAGAASVVMRRSADNGGSFFLTHRLDRKDPQGAYPSLHIMKFRSTAALPGVGFSVWGAFRDSVLWDAVLNAWDADDFDRDTAPDSSDCDIQNPGVLAIPSEVGDLRLSKPAAGQVQLSWQSQSLTAGSSTAYDIASGTLSELRGSGEFDLAACLQNDNTTTDYTDVRAPQPPGDGDYYLVRGQNSCGLGTFGDSTVTPDPRDALDDFFTPCP